MIRTLLVALALLASEFAVAQSSHEIAAREAVDASMAIDRQRLITQVVEAMLRKFPDDRPFAGEYERFVSETMLSGEFIAAKTRVYAQTFSESELRQLVELFRSPGYRLLQERQPELDGANRKAMVEVVMPRTADFFRRLDEVKRQKR